MFETFKVKNVLAPGSKQLKWSILCWLMFEIGVPWMLSPFFELKTESGFFWYQIANFCASFIITVLCFLPFLKESLERTDLKGLPKQAIFGYGIEYVLSLAASVGVVGLKFVFDEPTVNINQDVITQMLRYQPAVMIICTGLLVPITEECLVRGVMFAPICKKNPILAYLLSSTVFSILHLIASIGEMSWVNAVENFVTYLPSGIALGWLYQRTGTIIGPIALHCLSNLIAVVTILMMF